MKLATGQRIREIDAYAETAWGISPENLMKNAGHSAAQEIARILPEGSNVLILCGKGKNGGDGYVIAAELCRRGFSVTVFETDAPTRDTCAAYYRFEAADVLANEGDSGNGWGSLSNTVAFEEALARADAVVDALFGVGFHGELPEPEKTACVAANAAPVTRIAVDIPSGVNADSGAAAEGAFMADMTVTMLYPKRGCFLYPGRGHVGRLVLCDIGLDRRRIEEVFSFPCDATEGDAVFDALCRRPADSHKGTFGRLLLICGSDGMSGAAALAAEGALRCGVGLTELASVRRVCDVVAVRSPEVVFTEIPPIGDWDSGTFDVLLSRASQATAVVIGCGLTSHPNGKRLLETLLPVEGCPLLLDADALNSLDGDTELLSSARRPVVITPHPKEFARLCRCDIREVLRDRYTAAAESAQKCGITVLLKGASTVVAAKDGRAAINPTGNSGLAKGGSGDVLSGMIGAILARGCEPFFAAAVGAWLHGAAADRLLGEYGESGLLPRDLPAAAARVLAEMGER